MNLITQFSLSSHIIMNLNKRLPLQFLSNSSIASSMAEYTKLKELEDDDNEAALTKSTVSTQNLSSDGGQGSSSKDSKLIYSFVARGSIILAEYSNFTGTGNFSKIALWITPSLSDTNFGYNIITRGSYTFNYLTHHGFTYCVVAAESFDRHTAKAFLECIQGDFTKRYGGGKAATATAKSLNEEFGPKLKKHMQYYMKHQEEIAKVKAQVEIDVLMDKTDKLHDQAQIIREQGNHLSTKMDIMFIALIIMILLIVIIMS